METEALKEACALLPDGASWGDHVMPEMVLAIAEAARGNERERCAKALEQAADDGDEWRQPDGTRGMALRAAAKVLRGA